MSTHGYISISAPSASGIAHQSAHVGSDGYPSFILPLLADFFRHNDKNLAELKLRYDSKYTHLPKHYRFEMALDTVDFMTPDQDGAQYGYDYIITAERTLVCRKDGQIVDPMTYLDELLPEYVEQERKILTSAVNSLALSGITIGYIL